MQKRIMRLLFTLVAVLMLPLVVTEARAVETGTCGENLTWTLDDEGAMTISGSGAMANYISYYDVPWYADRESIKAVMIEDGATSICQYAFYGCSSLTGVTIGKGVTSIYYGAFMDCSSLKSIIIPESVTSIGRHAFYGCSSLTAITIPDSVTNIGGGVFQNCSSLTSVTIPDSITSIGDSTFYYCSNLRNVSIPDGVTSIGDSAFSGCSSLAAIAIPDSVTSIGDGAFTYCTSLSEITIPDGVTSIGEDTFFRCSGLIRITIPDSVTSIGEYAFNECSGITRITIPDNVTSIGDSAFSGCISLIGVAIPEGVTSIGDSAFSGCISLIGVAIPEGVTIIGNSVFRGCSGLTDVTIPEGVTSIGDYAFTNCNSLTGMIIPESVTSIGSYAFWGCRNMTDITISKGATSIGGGAFLGCSSLTGVTIPESVTSLGGSVFSNCYSLASITIPGSVTSIGYHAFYSCSKLTSITIGEGVTSIYYNAFDSCDKLNSIIIPESITSIAEDAFLNCRSLEDVYYGGTEAQWKTLSNRPNTAWIHYNSTSADGHWAMVTTPATCGTAGSSAERCSCGFTRNEKTIPATGEHNYSSAVISPTCTDDGYTTYTCVCGDSYTGDPVSKLDHDMGEWTTEEEATCTTEGSRRRDCSRCNYHETQDTEMIPHTYDKEVTEDRYLKSDATEMQSAIYFRSCCCGAKGTETFSYGDPLEPSDPTGPEEPQPEEDTSHENPFVDVFERDYYYGPVLWAVNKGITTGMDAIHFAPSDICSRGQIATFLWRANGSPDPKSGYNPFRDVKMTDYFYKAVLWAVENGITSGVSADSFAPYEPCTRGQVATFLYRAEKASFSGGSNIFTDIAPGAYYHDAVLWAVAEDITNGVGAGMFAPDAYCTRGQIVTFLHRAMAK